jgi:hypothetical protein
MTLADSKLKKLMAIGGEFMPAEDEEVLYRLTAELMEDYQRGCGRGLADLTPEDWEEFLKLVDADPRLQALARKYGQDSVRNLKPGWRLANPKVS